MANWGGGGGVGVGGGGGWGGGGGCQRFNDFELLSQLSGLTKVWFDLSRQ